MMSIMEKQAQIGELMELRENQKREVEHLRIKKEKVINAYRTYAINSERWMVDSMKPEVTFLRHPSSEERNIEQYLFNSSQLAELITQSDEAKNHLLATNEKLKNLGITGI